MLYQNNYLTIRLVILLRMQVRMYFDSNSHILVSSIKTPINGYQYSGSPGRILYWNTDPTESPLHEVISNLKKLTNRIQCIFAKTPIFYILHSFEKGVFYVERDIQS